MTAPPRAYQELAPGHRTSLAGAFKRPLLVAIILGTAVSIYTVRASPSGSR